MITILAPPPYPQAPQGLSWCHASWTYTYMCAVFDCPRFLFIACLLFMNYDPLIIGHVIYICPTADHLHTGHTSNNHTILHRDICQLHRTLNWQHNLINADISLTGAIWTCTISENNSINKHIFIKYLKESCWLNSYGYFSIKYFQNWAFINEIASKSSGYLSPLQAWMG